MVSPLRNTFASSEPTLAARVASFMNQRHLFAGCRVQAEVRRDTLTLRGDVPTENRRRLIERFAQRIDGVLHVEDRLKLTPTRYESGPSAI